jgi:hypothetical protein
VIFAFLNTREGIELNKAFIRIADARVRRSIVELVRSLVGEEAGKWPPLRGRASRGRHTDGYRGTARPAA